LLRCKAQIELSVTIYFSFSRFRKGIYICKDALSSKPRSLNYVGSGAKYHREKEACDRIKPVLWSKPSFCANPSLAAVQTAASFGCTGLGIKSPHSLRRSCPGKNKLNFLTAISMIPADSLVFRTKFSDNNS